MRNTPRETPTKNLSKITSFDKFRESSEKNLVVQTFNLGKLGNSQTKPFKPMISAIPSLSTALKSEIFGPISLALPSAAPAKLI
jgi:hypothetical protein